MKKSKKQMIGIQMLSEFCGLDVTINPTMSFLALVCHCLSRGEVKDLFGLSTWEYNRIFKEDFKDGFRWIRSPRMAFKTLQEHGAKKNLDLYQDELSFFLWQWIRSEYMGALVEELEDITEEAILDEHCEEFEFSLSVEDLNEVGLLILAHAEEVYNPEAAL